MSKLAERPNRHQGPRGGSSRIPTSTPDEDLMDLLSWGDDGADAEAPASEEPSATAPREKSPSIPATQKSPTSFGGLLQQGKGTAARPRAFALSSDSGKRTTIQHGSFDHLGSSLQFPPSDVPSAAPEPERVRLDTPAHKLKNPVFPANPRVPELAHTLRGARLNQDSDWELSRPPVDEDFANVDSAELDSRVASDCAITDIPPNSNEPSIVPSLRAQHLSTADGLHSLHNVQACFDRRDFEGALALAEAILDTDTYNFQARRYVESCRQVLEQEYTSRLAPLDRLIETRYSPTELPSLALNHRAGFVLSLVDGESTVEDLLDMSAMPRLDALRIVADLVEREIISPVRT